MWEQRTPAEVNSRDEGCQNPRLNSQLNPLFEQTRGTIRARSPHRRLRNR